MTNQGKTTSQFPVQTAPYDSNDRVVFIYGADTANTSNSVAQTSTITIQNLLTIPVSNNDPVNSTVTTVSVGTYWVTNAYFYIAVANNYVLRANLSSF